MFYSKYRDLSAFPLETSRYAALDIETTGVSPFEDRVVEVAVVVWQRGRRTVEASFLVDPGVPISEGARRVHGISDEELRGAPPFRAVAGAIEELLRDSIIVGHRALTFDVPILSMEMCRAGRPPLLNPIIDTSLVSKRPELLPTARRDLGSLTRSLDIRRTKSHRALPDARAALRVWLHLLDKFSDYGRRTLGDVVAYFAPPRFHPVGLELMSLARTSPDGSLLITYARGRGREERRIVPILPQRDAILAWSPEREAPRKFKYERILGFRVP